MHGSASSAREKEQRRRENVAEEINAAEAGGPGKERARKAPEAHRSLQQVDGRKKRTVERHASTQKSEDRCHLRHALEKGVWTAEGMDISQATARAGRSGKADEAVIKSKCSSVLILMRHALSRSVQHADPCPTPLPLNPHLQALICFAFRDMAKREQRLPLPSIHTQRKYHRTPQGRASAPQSCCTRFMRARASTFPGAGRCRFARRPFSPLRQHHHHPNPKASAPGCETPRHPQHAGKASGRWQNRKPAAATTAARAHAHNSRPPPPANERIVSTLASPYPLQPWLMPRCSRRQQFQSPQQAPPRRPDQRASPPTLLVRSPQRRQPSGG